MATASVDTSALRIHLNELKSEFDKTMREGASFSIVKSIYKEIKELEWQLKVLDWERNNDRAFSQRSAPYSEGRPYL